MEIKVVAKGGAIEVSGAEGERVEVNSLSGSAFTAEWKQAFQWRKAFTLSASQAQCVK